MEKYALITGASGGIGQSIAKVLAQSGWNLYLHYHQNDTKIHELVHELKQYQVTTFIIKADLSKSNEVKALASQIFQLDALIYTSGISKWGLFQDVSESEMDELWNIHVKSPMLLVQELQSKIMKNEGSIILTSSIWGQIGAACEVLYSTVKGAQNVFVKSLSKELARSRVRVNAVAPGAIATNMLKNFTQEDIEEIADDIPMGRLGSAVEVAHVVEFLLSEKASYMTGQIVGVNGGWNS